MCCRSVVARRPVTRLTEPLRARVFRLSSRERGVAIPTERPSVHGQLTKLLERYKNALRGCHSADQRLKDLIAWPGIRNDNVELE